MITICRKDEDSMTHLTFSERLTIEAGIEKGLTFRRIAKLINRHPTTVSREILENRTYVVSNYPMHNNCQHFRQCKYKNVCGDFKCNKPCKRCYMKNCRKICEKYKPSKCEKPMHIPYVCNCCSQKKICIHERYLYSARIAEEISHTRLVESRKGTHLSRVEIERLDKLLKRLINKGQPLVHIYEEHKDEIPVGLRSLYNLIDNRTLSVRNIDLRRKTGYKPRKGNKSKPLLEDMEFRKGRSYDDYIAKVKNPEKNVTELDTVKGVREKGKRLLTMIMRKNSIMLMFLLPDGTANSVKRAFDMLTDGLGLECFRRLFPVFLTDNGSEFKKVDDLELTDDSEERTKVFYCDPMASWQKGHVEKNHEYIRYVIPRGKSLNKYESEDITLLMNHINSIKRKSLENKCPYELVDPSDEDMQRLMYVMKMHLIPPDEVHLKPDLFNR